MSAQNETSRTVVPWRRYITALAPAVLLWGGLIGWLAWLLASGTNASREIDDATLQEWFNEARVFRKTLPALVDEYCALHEGRNAEGVSRKGAEIREHLSAMATPTRMYQGSLPLFPEIYRIDIRFPEYANDAHGPLPSLAWDSGVPPPRNQGGVRLLELNYDLLVSPNRRAELTCVYRLHAFNRWQQREREEARVRLIVAVVLIAGSFIALFGVIRFLRRERQRELREHLLNERLLAQQLETAELRAGLIENARVMAGAYAHNIKNLLVRPMDLVGRSRTDERIPNERREELQQAQQTLREIDNRVKRIMQETHSDPSRPLRKRIDLHSLLRSVEEAWREDCRKWRLQVICSFADESLVILGDESHLQQAIESLLFNSRDATFERRRGLLEKARTAPDPMASVKALSWMGEVCLVTERTPAGIVLRMIDNGIGMSEETIANCLKAKFSTKRGDAMLEGHGSGMGLGLTFVDLVIRNHNGRIEINSIPGTGATFSLIFPPPSEAPETENGTNG